MRYRKIATIEAFQYDGTFPLEVLGDDNRVRSAGDGTGACEIVTLEGVHRCEVGDWIACGVNGELWPIKPDVFAKSYIPDDAIRSLPSSPAPVGGREELALTILAAWSAQPTSPQNNWGNRALADLAADALIASGLGGRGVDAAMFDVEAVANHLYEKSEEAEAVEYGKRRGPFADQDDICRIYWRGEARAVLDAALVVK